MAHFRVRIIPVLGAFPALMGNAVASYVLCELAEQPFLPQEGAELKVKVWKKMLVCLMQTAGIISEFQAQRLLPFPMVQELYVNVFHCRSPVSGQQGGLQLVPWEFDSPIGGYNLGSASP